MESPKRQPQKLLVAVTTAMVVAAKRARRLPRRLAAAVMKEEWGVELRWKKTLMSKTTPLLRRNKKIKNKKKMMRGEEDWGKGGVWQKTILMGGKCEPLDFSGVIYYDSDGKQVNQMPNRSPRVTPIETTHIMI